MENFYEIDFKEVGLRMKKARKECGLTQAQAAEQAFITGQFWCLLELGKERASVNTYRQIAAVLGLTLDDLFYDGALTRRLNKTFSRANLLLECTNQEKAIIGEMLLSLRDILIKHLR